MFRGTFCVRNKVKWRFLPVSNFEEREFQPSSGIIFVFPPRISSIYGTAPFSIQERPWVLFWTLSSLRGVCGDLQFRKLVVWCQVFLEWTACSFFARKQRWIYLWRSSRLLRSSTCRTVRVALRVFLVRCVTSFAPWWNLSAPPHAHSHSGNRSPRMLKINSFRWLSLAGNSAQWRSVESVSRLEFSLSFLTGSAQDTRVLFVFNRVVCDPGVCLIFSRCVDSCNNGIDEVTRNSSSPFVHGKMSHGSFLWIFCAYHKCSQEVAHYMCRWWPAACLNSTLHFLNVTFPLRALISCRYLHKLLCVCAFCLLLF